MRDVTPQGFVGALALVAASAANAVPLAVAFDPAAAGLGSGAFLADAFVGEEVSVIRSLPRTFDPATGTLQWRESGYTNITAAMLGSQLQPTGLGTDYTLYVEFTLEGIQTLAGTGYATAGRVDLYGVEGVSTFAIDTSRLLPRATASHAGTPQQLATIELTPAGFLTFPYEDGIGATLAGSLLPVSPFFAAGGPIDVRGAFLHPSGLTSLYGGAVIVVEGGDDRLTFQSPVPEPATAMLWLAGAAGAAVLRRARIGATCRC